MEKIRELLSRLATLNADELSELQSEIRAEFKRIDDADGDANTPETVAAMNELADFLDQANAQSVANEAAAAEAAQARAAARDRIAALDPPEEPAADDDEAAKAKAAEEEAAKAEAEAAAEPAEPAAVAAAGTVARMAARSGRTKPSPGQIPERNRATLVASGRMRGIEPGAKIEDRYQLADAMSDTLNRMDKRGPAQGNVMVASSRWQYPEDRRLTDDQDHNARIMDAVTHPTALAASGGICAPTNVDYSMGVWATADRPLRDGFPSFEATRGGLLFTPPPDIGVWAGATGIWTEATDAAPGIATKPILSLQCANPVQVYVEAISTRIGFGNMQSRFSPEQVAANTDVAMAMAARIAENNLLNLLAALCNQNVSSAVSLGATRDLIMALHQAVTAYRNAHRIPDTQTITAVFPIWIRALIKIDLARELAHANDASFNVLMISDDQVDDLFRATGVNPIYHLDGQPNTVSGGVAQTFAIQPAGQAIETFPTKCVWYLYPEGQVQFLDGGRLDLGVVRDSTLDATNDYETFVEVFEALAFRGFNGGAIQYVSTLCADGASAATVSTVGSCA